MKLLFKLIFSFLLFFQCSMAMEQIPFLNINGKPFYLVAFHQIEKEKVCDGLYRLFQDEDVYRFYERGCAKTKDDCECLYDRVGARFKCWDYEDLTKDQLGWVAIVDAQGEFQGFIGAYIHKPEDGGPYSIEVALAVHPSIQREKVISYGLMELLLYCWPKLDPEIQSKIKYIKSPINPNNIASVALSEEFLEGSVAKEGYVPKYYENIAVEKGMRVDSIIPIEDALQRARDYQQS